MSATARPPAWPSPTWWAFAAANGRWGRWVFSALEAGEDRSTSSRRTGRCSTRWAFAAAR
eukprot:269467-Lingulodinium_polyedra.AAC.1